MSKNDKKAGPALRFTQDTGRNYPDWKELRLEDVTITFESGGTPSTENPDYWEGDIPWITGADVVNNKVKEVRRYITKDAVKKSSTVVVPKGNLLVLTRTGVGKAAIAPFDVAVSQDITGVTLDRSQILEDYLFQYLNANENALKSLNQGTSIGGITRSDLKRLKIQICSIPEQQKIGSFLTAIDDKIENLEQQLEALKAFKKGVMQGLFSEDEEHIMGGII